MFNFYVSAVSRKKVFYVPCRYVLHMPLDNRGWKKVEFYPKLFQSENYILKIIHVFKSGCALSHLKHRDLFWRISFKNSRVLLSKAEQLEGIIKNNYGFSHKLFNCNSFAVFIYLGRFWNDYFSQMKRKLSQYFQQISNSSKK